MAFGDTYEQTSKSDDSAWTHWVHRASDTDEAISILAVAQGGQFVGHVGSDRKDQICWLGAMWVEPAYRGQGLGARLLDAVLEWTDRTHPASEVRLMVVPTQEVAIRLYRSRGFVPTGKAFPLEHTPGMVYNEMARPARASGT